MEGDRSGTDTPTGGLEPGVGFHTIMFTDMVLSTDLRSRLGDEVADVLHHEVDALSRREVIEHRGTIVKGTGDGLMAVFRSPSDSLAAATALQQRMARRNRLAEVPISLRIGITAGEVEVIGDDVFGIAVNESARLCGAAPSDGALVESVAATLARRSDYVFGAPVEVVITPAAPPIEALPLLIADAFEPLVALPRSLEFADERGGFVGRSREMGTLIERWRRAREGSLEFVVVTGEPGIGKTTLLGEIARHVVGDGGIVLYGRCDERTAAPYQPFIDAFGMAAANLPSAELDRVFANAGPELLRLLPSLVERIDVPRPARQAEVDVEPWRIHDAVGGALRSLCDIDPVVLVIDDVQWAGATSLDLLLALLRDDAQHNLVIIAAMRPLETDGSPDVQRLMSNRQRLACSVTDLDLRGFDADEVRDLVVTWKQMAGVDRKRTDELWEITAGNPLFVAQVLQSSHGTEIVPTAIPQAVADVITPQLQRLAKPTWRFLRAAALIGQAFEVQLAAAAAGVTREESLDCLDEITMAGFVRSIASVPLRAEFVHAIVRRTVESQVPTARQRDIHARIAALIEESSIIDETEAVRRMAFHLSEAAEFGDPGKGVEFGCRAADDAIAHAAVGEALAILDRAAGLERLAPDARRAAETAVLRAEAMGLGSLAKTRDQQITAAALAAALGDGGLMARAALASSRDYFSVYGGTDPERVVMLEAALALSRPGDRSTTVLLMSRLADELNFDDPENRRFALLDDALSMARDLDDPRAVAGVLNHRLHVLGGPDHLRTRRIDVEEMCAIARAEGDSMLEVLALRRFYDVALEATDVARADESLARLAVLDDELGLVGVRWELRTAQTSRSILSGDLEAAGRQVNEALSAGVEAEQPDAYIFAGAQFLPLAYLTGRLPDIVTKMIEATSEQVTSQQSAWMARQAYLAGHLDEARRWWEKSQAIGIDAQLAVGLQAGIVLTSWCFMASVFPDDRSLLEDLRRRMEPFGERIFNNLAPDPPGFHFLALLDDALGDHERADEHFGASLDLLDRIEAPVLSALTQLAWARSLHRRGQSSRAVALAGLAASTARAAGATQIEQEAADVVAAAP